MATACRELTVHGPGPACHLVVTCMCTVERVEENVYKTSRVASQSHWSTHWNLSAHALASCVLPCHGHGAGEAHVSAYTRTDVSPRHDPGGLMLHIILYIYIHNYIHIYIYTNKRGPTRCKISCLTLRHSAIIAARQPQ